MKSVDKTYAAALKGRVPKYTNRPKVEGAVFAGGHIDPGAGYQVRSDINLIQKPENIFRMQDKVRESKILNRSLKGALPNSEYAGRFLKRKGSPISRLRALQAKLRAQYGDAGYVMKQVHGSDTKGRILTHSDDLVSVYKSKDDPRKRWVHEMLRNPNSMLVQERIPMAQERVLYGRMRGKRVHTVPSEYRVHVIDGQVVPKATYQRWSATSNLNPFKSRSRRQAEQEVQALLNNLPKKYRRGTPMALDVVRDTNGRLRLIETNMGGNSGFLQPDVTGAKTLAGHRLYKTVTGRDSPAMAAIKGLGYGGMTAYTGSKLMNDEKHKNTK